MKKAFKITLLLLVLIAVLYGWHLSLKIENTIMLPSFSYMDFKEYSMDYITVEGTITKDESSESSVGNVLNTNKFTCDKKIGKCTIIQAQLSDDNSNYLSVYTESYSIQSWDDNFVVFTTEPDAGQCVVWTYRIDRMKKELIGIREKRTDAKSELCSIIGNDKFVIKVVDGLDVLPHWGDDK